MRSPAATFAEPRIDLRMNRGGGPGDIGEGRPASKAHAEPAPAIHTSSAREQSAFQTKLDEAKERDDEDRRRANAKKRASPHPDATMEPTREDASRARTVHEHASDAIAERARSNESSNARATSDESKATVEPSAGEAGDAAAAVESEVAELVDPARAAADAKASDVQTTDRSSMRGATSEHGTTSEGLARPPVGPSSPHGHAGRTEETPREGAKRAARDHEVRETNAHTTADPPPDITEPIVVPPVVSPPAVERLAENVKTMTVVDASTARSAEDGEGAARVRAAEALGHRHALSLEARGRIVDPELGRVEVVARADKEASRIDVHVDADEVKTRQVLAAHSAELRAHVRVDVPNADVHVARSPEFSANHDQTHHPRAQHDQHGDAPPSPEKSGHVAKSIVRPPPTRGRVRLVL